jgi:LysR family transcriptional regulator, hca operon transcriptional activator
VRSETTDQQRAKSIIRDAQAQRSLPLYARNLLPSLLVNHPIRGVALMIDLVLRHNAVNRSPLFKVLLSKTENLKFRVFKTNSG